MYKRQVNKMTKSRIMFRGIKTSSGNQTAKLKSIQGITTFVCDPCAGIAFFADTGVIEGQGRKDLLGGSAGGGIGPVSYTHLDVYKRQASA